MFGLGCRGPVSNNVLSRDGNGLKGSFMAVFVALVLFFSVFSCGTGVFAGEQDEVSRSFLQDTWFHVGEELEYRIYWGFIPVGFSKIVTAWDEKNGKTVISVRYRAKTNSLFDRIYPVNDRMETIIDPETFLPVSYTKHIVRDNAFCSEIVAFDHEAGMAEWKSFCSGRSTNFNIRADTRDLVSHMYFLRKNNYKPGMVFSNDVVVVASVAPVEFRLLDMEDIDLPEYGEIKSIKVEPRAELGDILIKEGFVTGWVSTDPRGLCTKMTIKAPLGHATIILKEVKGPGYDFWVRKPEGMKEKE